jgi:hypothetical protein
VFLSQVNFLWRDLGRANGRRAALLLLAPFAVFAVLALPTALRETPAVAEHAEFSGTDSRTGPEIHLRDSYRVTVTISGQAGCSSSVTIGPWGFALPSLPTGEATSQPSVEKADMIDVHDGLYRIDMTATRCGPWTVILDRI